MIWLLSCLAFAQSLEQVESALVEAETNPTEQTCREARHISNAYRRISDGDTLAGMLETYGLELWYPYEDSRFAQSRYTSSFERDVGKNKKHPVAARMTCLMRDILYTEGRDVPAEQMSKFARKIKANCGPMRRVEKVVPVSEPVSKEPAVADAPSLEDLLLQSMKSRREYVNARGGSAELTARDAKEVEDTAKAMREISGSMDDLVTAQEEHEAAKAALMDALKQMPTVSDCQGEEREAMERVTSCTEWVTLNPTDLFSLLFLITAHAELAHAGVDSAHHASVGIARLRQLRALLPERLRGDIDKAIGELDPLVDR
ncbi:MAG: hypothetical protein ACI9MC_003310 [Kiritimatiellia bacterium]|jgi:hypothetical protein